VMRPPMLPTLMMRPAPRARISGKNARVITAKEGLRTAQCDFWDALLP
jgi:hypothetical protein